MRCLLLSYPNTAGPPGRRLRSRARPCPAAADERSDLGESLLGVSMGPIALSLGSSAKSREMCFTDFDAAAPSGEEAVRLNSLSTEEWQRRFVSEGACAEEALLAALPACLCADAAPLTAPALQIKPWTCGWRTTSTRRRACPRACRTAAAKMSPGLARSVPTPTWPCTRCKSGACRRAHRARGAVTRTAPAAPRGRSL